VTDATITVGGGCTIRPDRDDPGAALLLSVLGLWLAIRGGRRRGGTRARVASVVLLSLLLGTAVRADPPVDVRGAYEITVHGRPDPAITTRSSSEEPSRSRWWHVYDVQRDGLTARGRIVVVGSAAISIANFDVAAVFPGGGLEGEIRDLDGNHVATISGSVTRSGIVARVIATNGEQADLRYTPKYPQAWAAEYDATASAAVQP
jgi:hypothetical protein